MLLSGPCVMDSVLLTDGSETIWTMVPAVVISTISPVPVGCPPEAFEVVTVHQRLPCGPEIIMPTHWSGEIGSANSEIEPCGVILAILGRLTSENQRLPSGPAMMLFGKVFGVGRGYSMMLAFSRVRSSSVSSRNLPVPRPWARLCLEPVVRPNGS